MDTSRQALVEDQASRRRQMRTNEEKRRMVEETLVRGASVAAIARKHGVNANLLFGWRRLHQRGLLDQCREPAPLLPVKVTTPTLLPDRRSRPTKQRTRQPRTPAAVITAGHIEITLPGEIIVRVHGQIEPGTLGAVLNALRTR